MEMFDLLPDASAGDATTLLVSLDGWTDAGRGGTGAADHLTKLYGGEPIGWFDTDRLFDFRDRRPLLSIDRGMVGDPEWPLLELVRLDLGARSVLLLRGAEPDFRWPTLVSDVASLAERFGVTSYIGLGSVPGPVPHTRPTRLITTSSDPELLDRYGRPHEQVVVPGSFQVVLEATLRDDGLTTLGLWARVPHYVAGEYPAASAALLRRLGDHLGHVFDVEELDVEAAAHREQLDGAAEGSPEVQAHIEALEGAYDADADTGGIDGPLPTGDQIAAELERFLRNRSDG